MGKYLNKEQIFDAEGGVRVYMPMKGSLRLGWIFEKQIQAKTEDTPAEEQIKNLLEIGRIQIERYRDSDVWEKAFSAFDIARDNESWGLAVEACDVMFLSEGPDALKVLGHALCG